MQITVARNGQVLAQHEAEAIPALVQNGTILPTDHYWHDGMAEWAPVQSKWPAAAASPAASAAPPMLHGTATAAAPAATAASAPATGSADLAAIAQANPAVVSGARWFWWVAGLSLVNTILSHSGSQINFVIGLGFTLVVDALLKKLVLVALVIDALAIGFFFGVGWFSGKGRFWAFVVGAIAYACDLGLCLLGHDWMMIGFHGLALFYIGRGAFALRADVKAAKQAA